MKNEIIKGVPNDVVSRIFTFLTPKDSMNFFRICKNSMEQQEKILRNKYDDNRFENGKHLLDGEGVKLKFAIRGAAENSKQKKSVDEVKVDKILEIIDGLHTNDSVRFFAAVLWANYPAFVAPIEQILKVSGLKGLIQSFKLEIKEAPMKTLLGKFEPLLDDSNILLGIKIDKPFYESFNFSELSQLIKLIDVDSKPTLGSVYVK